jgi:hypothetical protein
MTIWLISAYNEFRLNKYTNSVRNSQETHYVSIILLTPCMWVKMGVTAEEQEDRLSQ